MMFLCLMSVLINWVRIQIERARRWINKDKLKPMIPRKKVEIQLLRSYNDLDKQMKKLNEMIGYDIMPEFTKLAANKLLFDINFFLELNPINENVKRLQRTADQLLFYDDIAVWMIYHIQKYVKMVNQYIHYSGGELNG